LDVAVDVLGQLISDEEGGITDQTLQFESIVRVIPEVNLQFGRGWKLLTAQNATISFQRFPNFGAQLGLSFFI